MAVDDFNADGDPDLAVANNTSGNVSVLLGGAVLAQLNAVVPPLDKLGLGPDAYLRSDS